MRSFRVACARGLLLAAALACVASAQETTEEPESGERPRIGLVLSGGGARGFAHIGVLEVLEALRIPVDVIAGTSMGTVVGGLYAQGLSAEQLAGEVENIDWLTAFNDHPPRRDLSLRRKRDDLLFLTGLRLFMQDDFSLAFPKGLVEGQKITNILAGLTLPAATVRDFDELSIPFRAVASDARTGEAVVLRGGELSRAIRASMAIPGIFSPVDIDGLLLVDGMVAMNLPVEVAEDLGADVIIAVDIGTRPSDTAELASIFSVGGQTLNVLTHRNTLDSLDRLREQDILIRPELGDITSMSFARGEEGIERGREAALALAAALAPYSLSEEAWERWFTRRQAIPREPPVIDAIRLDNRTHLADQVIERRIDLSVGEPLDVEALQQDLAQLYGEGTFERVIFSVDEADGRKELTIHAVGKEAGRNWLRFGLQLETNFRGESQFELGALATRNPVNRFGAEARGAVAIGEQSGVVAEYYQPLDYGSHFFALPFVSYQVGSRNLFVSGERIGTLETSELATGGLLGWQPTNWFELRGGIAYQDFQLSRQIGDPAIPDLEFEGGNLVGELLVDTLDNVRFPRSGTFATGDVQYLDDALGADESLGIAEVRLAHSRSLGENTLTFSGRFGTLFEDDRGIPIFTLGGFLDLSGTIPDERSGANVLFGSLIYYRRLANPRFFTLNLPIYLGGSIEAGNTFAKRGDIEPRNMLIAGSVFFGIDTPIGPIYLAYGHSEGGNQSGYFFLGQVF